MYVNTFNEQQRNIGGCLRGSTIVKSKERNEKFVKMFNYVLQKYDESQLNGVKILNGMFNEIVNEANNKFNMNEKISIKTIQSMHCRKIFFVEHCGTPTSMAPLESAL